MFRAWQALGMVGPSGFVHLRRIDPSRRIWRYYSLALQPTLLGGVDLICRWGRTGTKGTGSILTETYPDEASAQAALDRLAVLKRRRGYA